MLFLFDSIDRTKLEKKKFAAQVVHCERGHGQNELESNISILQRPEETIFLNNDKKQFEDNESPFVKKLFKLHENSIVQNSLNLAIQSMLCAQTS